MRKKLLTGIIAALGLSLGMTSCGDESSSLGTDMSIGMGRISPKVVIDGSIISASIEQASRASGDVSVTVSDLKLKLISDDGSFSQEWESVDDFDETQDFKVGDYTLEAYYGNENDAEGYSKPHFHGSQSLTVKFDHTTTVALSASMKNSRVFVRYTDAFKDYMSAYSVQIHTPKGKYVTMAADEVSPVYVTPGLVNVNLSFTKPNGKNATIEAARFEAKAKTEHVVTIDIEGGDAGADATLKVKFDDTIDTEDVEIDVSDDLIDAPEPELTPEGWTDGQEFPHIENSPAPNQIKANIIARGKIESVYLNTSSSTLYSEGWPEHIDLAKADATTVALLTNLGLKARGIWNRPDVMGVLDFTDVFTHLGVGLGLEESTHTFSLQVKDRYGKLSPVMEFSVVSGAGSVEIHSATAEIGHKNIEAEVEYNGTNDLADVTFQLRNLLGAWDDLVLNEATPIAGRAGCYNVKLTSPSVINSTQTLRAIFGSTHSEFALEVTTPPFELMVSENDVFAHKATVSLNCETADDAAVAKRVDITVNGRNYDNYEVEDADIVLTGLRAGVEYTVEAKSTTHSASVIFTTETEDHLPGCEESEDGQRSVGFKTDKWTGTRMGGNTNNCLQYLWSFEGWATMNELTVSQHGTGIGNGLNTRGCSYKATSGTIPANSRSTQSSADGAWDGRTTHSDGHTIGDKSLHNNRQRNGSNAALIRTVGWGNNNSAHSATAMNIKNNQGFGTCQNRTQGELYLGQYDNGPKYGYNFTSRPSGLTFYYHYDPAVAGNGDHGTAEIHLYDANGEEISHSEVALLTENSSDRWTDTSKRMPYSQVTIPITYERGANKAASISIIFRSTEPDQDNNPALKENNTYYWNTPGGNNTSGGEYVGSELYIDDVRLIY